MKKACVHGRIQGGDWGDLPLKLSTVTSITMILYNSENNFRDVRPFAVHCFVTEVL